MSEEKKTEAPEQQIEGISEEELESVAGGATNAALSAVAAEGAKSLAPALKGPGSWNPYASWIRVSEVYSGKDKLNQQILNQVGSLLKK